MIFNNPKIIKVATLICLFISFSSTIIAQESEKKIKYGFNYGKGELGNFPFEDKDYSYETTFYKAQINYILKDKEKFNLELNIEPSYYVSEHQLLNKYFIKPGDYDDYLTEREIMTTKKTMKEYVLNLGIIARYKFVKNLSAYALGSVGPMIIDTRTERMAKGFAFSDIFSLGLSYKINKITLDTRYSARHVSNLQLQSPNSGYNSTNFEFGFLVEL